MTQFVGAYEVEQLIGDGGMGTVYQGRDPRFDRDLAIKVLHPHFARDPEVVARFRSEAIIQAKLNHPNIATVFDFVADGNTLAMVMEFVDGPTLEQEIASHGPIPKERAVGIMTQVLSAVGFAHSKALVHRDLKPSNIMVQRLGGEEVVKVMDFGVAKILGSDKLRTATSAKIGTLAYMSPEHIRSPRSVDTRSDIYSLGIVLYEILTGKLPLDADSEYEVMHKIVQGTIDLGGIHGPLRDVVAIATHKEPSRRYQNCDQMKVAISSPVRPQGVAHSSSAPSFQTQELPGPRPSPQQTTSNSQKHQRVVVIGLAGALVLLTYLLFHSLGGPHSVKTGPARAIPTSLNQTATVDTSKSLGDVAATATISHQIAHVPTSATSPLRPAAENSERPVVKSARQPVTPASPVSKKERPRERQKMDDKAHIAAAERPTTIIESAPRKQIDQADAGPAVDSDTWVRKLSEIQALIYSKKFLDAETLAEGIINAPDAPLHTVSTARDLERRADQDLSEIASASPPSGDPRVYAVLAYGYVPSDGFVLKIVRVNFDQNVLKPGSQMTVDVRWVVISPEPNERITIKTTAGLRYSDSNNTYLATVGPNPFTLTGGGVVDTMIPVTVPQNAPAGKYTVDAIIDDGQGGAHDRASASVRLQRD